MNVTNTGSRSRYRVRGSRRGASHGSGEKSVKSGWIVPPAATQVRSPDRKFECGIDGGKPLEITIMMNRRKLEVLRIQETKWKGDRTRTVAGGYKMLHAVGDGKSNEIRNQ